MILHLIHNWTEWKTDKREVIEIKGMLIPYHTQTRECKKCKLFQVKLSNIKSFWKLK